jgi:hypothetical protein
VAIYLSSVPTQYNHDDNTIIITKAQAYNHPTNSCCFTQVTIPHTSPSLILRRWLHPIIFPIMSIFVTSIPP